MALSDEELRTIAAMEVDLAADLLYDPPHETRSRAPSWVPSFGGFEWTVIAVLGAVLLSVGLSDDRGIGVVLAVLGYVGIVLPLVPAARWSRRKLAQWIRKGAESAPLRHYE